MPEACEADRHRVEGRSVKGTSRKWIVAIRKAKEHTYSKNKTKQNEEHKYPPELRRGVNYIPVFLKLERNICNGGRELQGDTYTQERCGATAPHPSGVMCNRRKEMDEKRLCWAPKD